MKTANFNDTVDILVKAYLNGTLAHGSCAACAVGNIVAYTKKTQPLPDPDNKYTGFAYSRFTNGEFARWQEVFVTCDNIQELRPEMYTGWIQQEIDATGYSWAELAKIEFAFESAPHTCKNIEGQNEEWMFNGLMAVVSVLAEIHGISLDETDKARKLFNKIPA